MLVLRDQACQFFWIKNVAVSLNINKFQSSQELEDSVGTEDNMIPDYIIIPAEKSGSSQLELLVADPQEGFHLLV